MTTARGIAAATLAGMRGLELKYDRKDDLFADISKLSGVSESMCRKFYYGDRSNPSVDIIDKLSAGVKALMETK